MIPGACATATRAGQVQLLRSFGSLLVDGNLFDRVPHQLGEAKLEAPPCAHYEPSPCSGCEAEQVCSYTGTCTEPAQPIAAAEVTVARGALTERLTIDAGTGRFEGFFADDQSTAAATLSLRIPGVGVATFAHAMPETLGQVTASDPNNNGGSGPVTVSWQSANDDAQMYVFLKPNHHAPSGFSECVVDDSVASVTATADIIEPLRRVTGFEGGQAIRRFVAHVDLAQGCVELVIGDAQTLIVGP